MNSITCPYCGAVGDGKTLYDLNVALYGRLPNVATDCHDREVRAERDRQWTAACAPGPRLTPETARAAVVAMARADLILEALERRYRDGGFSDSTTMSVVERTLEASRASVVWPPPLERADVSDFPWRKAAVDEDGVVAYQPSLFRRLLSTPEPPEEWYVEQLVNSSCGTWEASRNVIIGDRHRFFSRREAKAAVYAHGDGVVTYRLVSTRTGPETALCAPPEEWFVELLVNEVWVASGNQVIGNRHRFSTREEALAAIYKHAPRAGVVTYRLVSTRTGPEEALCALCAPLEEWYVERRVTGTETWITSNNQVIGDRHRFPSRREALAAVYAHGGILSTYRLVSTRIGPEEWPL